MKNKSLIGRRELLTQGTIAGCAAMLGWPRGLLAAESMADPMDELRTLIRGDLVTPTDDGYDAARKVWNEMIDRRPLAIARCTGAADVIDVVRFARERDIPVTVRGGGHNVSGKAVRDGALTIDLVRMRGIRVDPEARIGRVQGGATWAEFDRETLAFGLATTGGTVATTGVGGLTLGGGLGWLMRKHGLSIDNLRSADVVTADGRLLKASADENDDLFWALRGGGGNFGVVTSFEFNLHQLDPITGGIAMYPESMARDVLRFYRDYTSNAPDNVTAAGGVLIGPPGTPIEGQAAGWIAACHCGPADEGERLLRPIKDLGPVIDTIAPKGYGDMQATFASGGPAGRNYWRSNFMHDLSDDAIDTMIEVSKTMPRPLSLLLLEHMGGAVGRVGEQATAFSNRSAKYNLSMLSTWSDAADDERYVAWTRSNGDELKKFTTGAGYVNYMTGDESAERVRATYEANFQRLVAIKRKYDPDNFFSGNQNIAP